MQKVAIYLTANDQSWLNKVVFNPKTRRKVKVSSLPPELRKIYAPHYEIDHNEDSDIVGDLLKAAKTHPMETLTHPFAHESEIHNPDDHTPMHKVIFHHGDDEKIMKKLIQHPEAHSSGALSYLAKKTDNPNTIKQILNHPKADQKTLHGSSPLHILAKRGIEESKNHPSFTTAKNIHKKTPQDIFGKNKDW